MILEILKEFTNQNINKCNKFIIVSPDCNISLPIMEFSHSLLIPSSKYSIIAFKNETTIPLELKCQCAEKSHEEHDIQFWVEMDEKGLSDDAPELWRGQETIVIFIFESIHDRESLANFDKLLKEYKIACSERVVMFHLTAKQAQDFTLHTEITKKLKKQSIRYYFCPITHFMKAAG